MQNDSPIGFFDSGVGGLSVFSRFRAALPNENTIYFGDLKNLPYGNKSQEELTAFARTILDFFKTKNVKAVVIACNTSSAMAYEAIKDDYDFKIYPIIQSCAKVIASMDLDSIGIFATAGTVSSNVYQKEINKYNPAIKVFQIACPNWVGIVEGVFDGDSNIDIKNHIEEMLQNNPDKIVLGCTHYPYLLNELEKYTDKNCFIDPAEIFVEFIKKDLEEHNLLNTSRTIASEAFYVSANPEAFVENAKLFYSVKSIPSVL